MKNESNKQVARDVILCGICNHNKKIAVTVNEISICYECLRFIENRAKQHGVDQIMQLEKDTKFISLNATKKL